MSSMVRKTVAFLLIGTAFLPLSAHAQDGTEWDRARADLRANDAGIMAQAIARWKLLSASDRFSFGEYSSFLLAYPGFPEEAKLRAYAERALDRDGADTGRVVSYFDRFAPVTNPARAQYALALLGMRRPEAMRVALEAWRGGAMSDANEAALFAQLAPTLRSDDHDARMNALLWQGATAQAERQALYLSAGIRTVQIARLGYGQWPRSGSERPRGWA